MKYIAFDIGIKNLAYCIINSDNYEIVDWNILDISTDKKKNKIYEIMGKIIDTLDINKHFLELDTILIENQPCMKNPVMKSIQIMIFTYFNMKKKEYNNIKNIVLVSPRTKFKCYEGPEDIIQFPNIKSAYTIRKKKAIVCCRWMLEQSKINNYLIEFYNNHKKKDDLADSYLLCMTYLKKNNILPVI